MGLRRARSKKRNGEDGFTVIEMLVAMMVLGIVMTSLMYVTATSLKQVAFSKQRQTASGLVDKTMEQARALPYTMIQTGLDDHDVTTSSDSSISISGSTYTYTPTGETIVHGNQNGNASCPGATVCQVPLVPHRSTTSLNNTTYTISTYVTNFSGSTGAYRITVVVSWSPSQVSGVSNQVSSQSVIYSPSNGCVSDQTHPFSAPCQPFLYAQASTGKGSITVSPVVGASGNPIQGVSLTQAELDMAQVDSAMQIEQTSKVQGSLTTSGTVLNVGSAQTSGGTSTSSQADNDPATPATTQPSCPVSQGSTSTLSATDLGGSGNGISLTSSSGDSGCTVSTASASSSSTPTCNDTLGVAQNTALPCGSGTVQQTGASESAGLTLGLAGLSLGSTSIASVAAAPSSSKVFTSRLTSAGATSCTTMGTSSDGCVHAEAQRSLGTVTLGALPASVLSLLPLWGSGTGNFLVQLSGYSDAVRAESGIGAAAPCANQASTCSGTASGTLKYWNGLGYTTTTVSWGATPPSITIPSVSVSGLVAGVVVNVSMTNTLKFGTTSTTTSGPSPNTATGCRTVECKATAEVTSPIQGDIIYTVQVAGSTVANVDIHVDLGTLAVQTNYRAAPLAS